MKYKQLYQKQQQGLSMPVQMLASLFLFHTLLNLIFISVGIPECALLPWLLEVEKRHIKTVIESTSGKLSNMADKTEGKIILHIKHPLNDKVVAWECCLLPVYDWESVNTLWQSEVTNTVTFRAAWHPFLVNLVFLLDTL